MDGLHQSCGGYIRETFVVEQVSNHFPDRKLPGSDTGAHSLTVEGRLSASRIVGRKRLLIDWLKNGNCCLILVPKQIGSARALSGKGWKLVKLEASVGPIDALGDDEVLRHRG